MRLWRRRTPPADDSVAAAMRRALRGVLRADLPAAEEALAEAARLDSSSVDVYLALASVYRARGDVGRAIQVHQNVLLRPDLSESLRREALVGLAQDFRSGGFLKRSVAAFEEVLEQDAWNLEALEALERIRVESGDWEAAIAIRRRIGRRDPATPSILAHLWTGLGRSWIEAGQGREARRAFKRALGHDPRCAEAYLVLGDERMAEGKVRKAIELWRRALPLHRAIGLLLYPRLARAFERAGDLEGFETLLRERAQAEPADREAPLWLARVVGRQGRTDEALVPLRRLLGESPDWLPAQAEIARLLLREDRASEALKALEALLEQLPRQRPVLRCRSCGAVDADLHFRCPQCGEWDSF